MGNLVTGRTASNFTILFALAAGGLTLPSAAGAAPPDIVYRSASTTEAVSAVAECPSNRRIVGGGALTTQPPLITHGPAFINSAHALDLRHWLASGQYDEHFESHATCLRKKLGVPTLVPGDIKNVLASQANSAEVHCPAGRRVSGGGALVGEDSSVRLVSSYPIDEPTDADTLPDDGWRVIVENISSTQNYAFRAEALCLGKGRSRLRYRRKDRPDVGPSVAPIKVDCPTRSRVLSGGLLSAPAQNAVVTESVRADGPDGGTARNDAWHLNSFIDDGLEHDQYAFAICRKRPKRR